MKHIGAGFSGPETVVFTVWAPEKNRMTLHLVHPTDRLVPMEKDNEGYFNVTVAGINAGARYFFRPENDTDYPDPASRFQPEGVHGPSEVVDHSAYVWQDQSWRGLPFRDLILYELHVGTFTPEGSFEAIIPRLDALVETGINAVEIMPIAQFPGNRNWGYDGVFPYSVQHSYGGPKGFKKLVDACHARGIAVFLDVVYNHVGPEGNYFGYFGPYFSHKYHTPWGDAINFDGLWSDGVRDFFIDNALFWFEEFHVDGLRFDAIHEIFDMGAVSIWAQLHDNVKRLEQRLGRPLHLLAESDLNDPKILKTPELGGFGFDAQWLDDFHHSLYVLLDQNGKNRYGDYGRMEQLAKAYTDGFVMSGEYTAFRKRKFGASSAGIPGDHFVVFNLNHDQVGNRIGGERLSVLVDFERLKVAAAAVMLSPYVPLLFMGEEYADETPFFYFADHSEEDLIQAVKKGRKAEFAAFNADDEHSDPFQDATFTDSKLRWENRTVGKHRIMLDWHRTLIDLRRIEPVLRNMAKSGIQVTVLGSAGFVLHRQDSDGLNHLLGLFNLSDEEVDYALPDWVSGWQKRLDSKALKWLENPETALPVLPEQPNPGQTLRLPPVSVAVYLGR